MVHMLNCYERGRERERERAKLAKDRSISSAELCRRLANKRSRSESRQSINSRRSKKEAFAGVSSTNAVGTWLSRLLEKPCRIKGKADRDNHSRKNKWAQRTSRESVKLHAFECTRLPNIHTHTHMDTRSLYLDAPTCRYVFPPERGRARDE